MCGIFCGREGQIEKECPEMNEKWACELKKVCREERYRDERERERAKLEKRSESKDVWTRKQLIDWFNQLNGISASLPRKNHLLVQLSTVGDHNLGLGLAALRAVWLHLLDNVQALHDLAKHDVLSVQPLRLHGAKKKSQRQKIVKKIKHRKF